MDAFALTPAERALFSALRNREVRFLIIGLGAAVLEGAPVATQDIDLWFETLQSDQIALAARGDVWMIERREHLRFARKPREAVRVVRE